MIKLEVPKPTALMIQSEQTYQDFYWENHARLNTFKITKTIALLYWAGITVPG